MSESKRWKEELSGPPPDRLVARTAETASDLTTAGVPSKATSNQKFGVPERWPKRPSRRQVAAEESTLAHIASDVSHSSFGHGVFAFANSELAFCICQISMLAETILTSSSRPPDIQSIDAG